MTTAKWMLYAKKADFNGIGTHFHISPVIARIIRNRDVCGDENIEKYLRGTWKDLYSPHRLKMADLAAGLLLEKIRQGKRIRIVGDYDIDGVCSTYLLYKGLKRLGAAVDYEIPDRIKDGYGINIQIVEAAAEDNIDTILTCDNGISAIDQMKRARELGMTVIVTDHHDIVKAGEEDVLPEADAIVNPKQSADTYPWKEICGGMVAYKLIQILYEKAGIDREEWLAMIEFAAIATGGRCDEAAGGEPDRGERRAAAGSADEECGTSQAGGEKQPGYYGVECLPHRFCHRSVSQCGRAAPDGKAGAQTAFVRG